MITDSQFENSVFFSNRDINPTTIVDLMVLNSLYRRRRNSNPTVDLSVRRFSISAEEKIDWVLTYSLVRASMVELDLDLQRNYVRARARAGDVVIAPSVGPRFKEELASKGVTILTTSGQIDRHSLLYDDTSFDKMGNVFVIDGDHFRRVAGVRLGYIISKLLFNQLQTFIVLDVLTE